MARAIVVIWLLWAAAAAVPGTAAGGVGGRTPPADGAPADLLAEARALAARDRLREADALLAKALDSGRDGSDSSLAADLLLERGRVLDRLGAHERAAPLLERALELRARLLGDEHPGTAAVLPELASVALKRGDFARARELCERALRILDATLGPAHASAARAAIGLAAALDDQGDHEGAERILRDHLDATLAAGGERSREAAELMLALAATLAMTRQHVESAELYRRAAAVAEATYGPDHSRTAAALSGVAHTLRRIGRHPAAEALYRRCLWIVERNHGTPHPDTIHYRCRLGMALLNQRRVDEAVAEIERGIAEAAAIYGPDSHQVALEQRHLGLALVYAAHPGEARAVLEGCLATLTARYGPDHLFLSKCLKGLARAELALGRPEEALRHVRRAVAVQRRAQGGEPLEIAYLLRLQTSIELAARAWDAAVVSGLQGVAASLEVLEESYQASTLQETLLLADSPRASASLLVSAAVAHPDPPDSLLARTLALVARSHGVVMGRLAARHRLLGEASGSLRLEDAWQRYVTATQRLADLVTGEPGGGGQTRSAAIAAAQREQEAADRELASATEPLLRAGEQEAGPVEVTVARLAAAMPSGSSLVHFVTLLDWSRDGSNGDAVHRPHYAAFVLRTAAGGDPAVSLLDLGATAPVDSLIAAYRRLIERGATGHRPSAREEATYRDVAAALHERVWAPLGLVDGDAPLVFIVPAGRLSLLDFATLLSAEGRLLIEDWRLHLLPSARELLRHLAPGPSGRGLLAVGNPLCPSGDDGAPTPPAGRPAPPAFCADALYPSLPLPGAEAEVASLAALHAQASGEAVTALVKGEATESEVKQRMPGRRRVHLATHGFDCGLDAADRRHYSEQLADPLLMTGLLLTPGAEPDDGILTAQEIVCLDLRGLDWVVLSACDSGLGHLIEGEGLFGLRRAFLIAGARTVIMALWRQDDVLLSGVMERIYAERLAGRATVDAVRRPQLERLREARSRFNRIHPCLWGGIVAEGDWR